MDALKKILGVVWLLLAPVLIILMFNQFFYRNPCLKGSNRGG
jgi:hypothetical protein